MNYTEMEQAFREGKPVIYGGKVYPRISALITRKISPEFTATYVTAELEIGENVTPTLCVDYDNLEIYDEVKHDGFVWKDYRRVQE